MNLVQVFEEAKENLATTFEEYYQTPGNTKQRYICLAIEFRNKSKHQYDPETIKALEIVEATIAPHGVFTCYVKAQRGISDGSPESVLGTFEEIQQLRLEFIDSIIAKLKEKA